MFSTGNIEPFHLDGQTSATSSSGESSTPQRYLNCSGRACSICGRCRDWHRVDTHWTLTNGGTCTASKCWIYLHAPVLCACKTYY